MPDFTNATTTLGKQIYEQLFRTDTTDQLADAQRVSGNNLTSLEGDYVNAASLEDNPDKIKAWATEHGYGEIRNQNALLSVIDSKLNRSTQVFMGLQKMRGRVSDLMMELIRALGK